MKMIKILLIPITIVALAAILILFRFYLTDIKRTEGEEKKLTDEISFLDNEIILKRGWHRYIKLNSVFLNDIDDYGFNAVIKYPEIKLKANPQIEQKLNQEINEVFGIGEKAKFHEQYFGCDTSIKYECNFFHNILTVANLNLYYTCGAAHASVGKSTFHFNLKTGEIFNAEDCFIKYGNWDKDIANIIKVRMDENDYSYNYDHEDSYFLDNIGDYNLCSDGVEISYMPYMGPAPGGGYITVKLLYSEIKSYIKKDSPLWEAINLL